LKTHDIDVNFYFFQLKGERNKLFATTPETKKKKVEDGKERKESRGFVGYSVMM